MIAVTGTYENGYVKLDSQVSSENNVKVIVSFPGDIHSEQNQRLSLSDFSFLESQEILKNYTGSFSDAVVEERRTEL